MKKRKRLNIDSLYLNKLKRFEKLQEELMNFGWKNNKEKIAAYLNIPPKKKLELLRAINEFTVLTSSKRMMALRWKLRENR